MFSPFSAQCFTCYECLVVGGTDCFDAKKVECPQPQILPKPQEPQKSDESQKSHESHESQESHKPPKPQCMTMSEYCVVGNKQLRSIKKTCGNELCNLCITLTTNHGFKVRVSTQCGKGDGSNANLNFTERCNSLKTNGLKCPSCYEKTTDGCEADGTVDCVQGETQCVDYAGVVHYSDGSVSPLSFKGCIVTGGCKVGFAALPGSEEMSRKKFDCTDAVKKRAVLLNLY
ncbi:uncharacterized protein LOC142107409 [Mixophyes fleayi]|uniref:uncharacterized protein LOC142107409 n=1 Tax=Mixophyes fleayi TaxID=3061075 RepID=UPI003F4DEA7D